MYNRNLSKPSKFFLCYSITFLFRARGSMYAALNYIKNLRVKDDTRVSFIESKIR